MLLLDYYKNQALDILTMEYPELADEKRASAVKKRINEIIKERVKNPPVMVDNNYRNKYIHTSLLEISEFILKGKFILGGDGCLFTQHEIMLSPLYRVIDVLQLHRKKLKKIRDTFDKVIDEDMWISSDNGQNNKKTAVNALYGYLGYMRSYLFNVNLAQSVTATGQNIIATAACCFENFMEDNILFICYTEVTTYLNNLQKEYVSISETKLFMFNNIDPVTPADVCKRLAKKLGFRMTEAQASSIAKIINNMEMNLLKLVMYKNNFMEFNNTPFMKNLLKTTLNKIEVLRLPDEFAFVNKEYAGTIAADDAPEYVKMVKEYYETFVLYTNPVYDKVRRTKYTTKKSVLYVDTDSNFLGLDKFIQWIGNEMNVDLETDIEFNFKTVSLYTMVLSMAVAKCFGTFTKSLNIDPKYGAALKMKNEFYFPMLFFAVVKKRYAGIMMLQEGKVLNDGEGLIEIKGFDFKKAGTKAIIRTKFEGIIEHEILRAKQIRIKNVMNAFDEVKDSIKDNIFSGGNDFYKQGTVKILEHYALPFSNQSVKALLTWNALNPTEILDPPTEIDIVPINIYNGMTKKKLQNLIDFGPDAFFSDKKMSNNLVNLKNFRDRYPEQFELFMKNIIHNSNQKIQNMTLNVIAKPRVYGELPEWLRSIIDVDKIILDAVNLCNPILESMGCTIQSASAKIKQYSNIIEI